MNTCANMTQENMTKAVDRGVTFRFPGKITDNEIKDEVSGLKGELCAVTHVAVPVLDGWSYGTAATGNVLKQVIVPATMTATDTVRGTDVHVRRFCAAALDPIMRSIGKHPTPESLGAAMSTLLAEVLPTNSDHVTPETVLHRTLATLATKLKLYNNMYTIAYTLTAPDAEGFCCIDKYAAAICRDSTGDKARGRQIACGRLDKCPVRLHENDAEAQITERTPRALMEAIVSGARPIKGGY
jgi:hypothetical protein